MDGPLTGIRIIDWTMWQQGPVATSLLGDLGAEVIKLEDTMGGDPGRAITVMRGVPTNLPDGRNAYFEYNNHNKKSITINLKKEKGREIIYRLAPKIDVFVQNLRPGVAEKLGLGYSALSQRNPLLIYATGSGYGLKGTDTTRPAFDYIALARSGMMTAVGEPDMPPLEMAGGIADQTGAIILAYGILGALFARERHGFGQEINASLLGSMVTLQGLNVAATTWLGELPRQRRKDKYNPLWNHYECKDSRWIVLAHLQPDRYWGDLCRAMGLSHLERHPHFENMQVRQAHARELIEILDKTFATKTYDEWEKILRETGGFVFDAVQNVSDLVSDPQVIENEYIAEFDHPTLGVIKMPGFPVKFSKTPGSFRLPAPQIGQHTEEVLNEICGYDWDEIAQLKEEEVI